MLFYAIADNGSRQFCAEDRLTVLAFSSRRDRDAWVEDPEGIYTTVSRSTANAPRRAATRQEAARALREIYQSITGNPRESGYAALRQMAPESLGSLRV